MSITLNIVLCQEEHHDVAFCPTLRHLSINSSAIDLLTPKLYTLVLLLHVLLLRRVERSRFQRDSFGKYRDYENNIKRIL